MDPSMKDPVMLDFMAAVLPPSHRIPFKQLPPVMTQATNIWADAPRIPAELLQGAPAMSQLRAKLAAMDHDAISAGLWALSSFDPALVHLAELRENFAKKKLAEEDPLRVTLDRMTSVYLEGQCSKLLEGAEITRHDADVLIIRLGNVDETALRIVDCTDDPLAMEIMAYALYLGSLTAHGDAPWKRFAATMSECHHQRQPA